MERRKTLDQEKGKEGSFSKDALLAFYFNCKLI